MLLVDCGDEEFGVGMGVCCWDCGDEEFELGDGSMLDEEFASADESGERDWDQSGPTNSTHTISIFTN